MPTAGNQASGLYRPNTMGGVQHTAAPNPQGAPPPAAAQSTSFGSGSGSPYDFQGSIGDYYGWRDPVTGKMHKPKYSMPSDPAARKYLEDFRKNVFSYMFQPWRYSP